MPCAGVVQLRDVFVHKGRDIVLVMERADCDLDALIRAEHVRRGGGGEAGTASQPRGAAAVRKGC